MPVLPGITLQPHQQAGTDDALAAQQSGQPYRVLRHWSVGSGKGLSSLSTADALGGQSAAIVPAAMRPTFRGESQKFLGRSDIPVTSYQGAAAGKVPEDVNTLIVDEAQRLSSPGSSQAAAVQEAAQRARNVILLSGTPTRNSPKEFAALMSILTQKPISQDEFAERYVGTEKSRPGGIFGWIRGLPQTERPALIHTQELKDALRGHVDYYSPEKPSIGVTHETHEAEMSPRQSELYAGMMGKLPLLLRWKLKFSYPLSDDEMVRARSFLTGPRQVALSDLPYRQDGDAHRAFMNSGKLTKAFNLMKGSLDEDLRKKGIVYSNFLKAGLIPYAAALQKEGIPHAIFHGGLSDVERKQLVDNFKSGKIRVALVAPSGAEGISLKGAQTLQLLDGGWNEARSTQAIGRGIRYDSHSDLPEDLRHITVQRFVSKLPLGVKDRLLESIGMDRSAKRMAVDDYMFNLAGRKEQLNKQLHDLLKEVGTRKTAAEIDRDVEEIGFVLSGDEVEKLAALSWVVGTSSEKSASDDIDAEIQAEWDKGHTEKRYLGRYKCPHCGGTNMFNGIPGTGSTFRGSGHCQDCDKGCSIVGAKLKPIGDGPEIVSTPEQKENFWRWKRREIEMRRDEKQSAYPAIDRGEMNKVAGPLDIFKLRPSAPLRLPVPTPHVPLRLPTPVPVPSAVPMPKIPTLPTGTGSRVLEGLSPQLPPVKPSILSTATSAAKTVAQPVVAATRATAGATSAAAGGAGNYVKSLAGYGPGGALEGQKLLDSTTVKPFLPRAQMLDRVAAGATKEDLAKQFSMPAWYHRLPGTNTTSSVYNSLNRMPLLHPLIQTQKTLGNILTTPLTRPIVRPLASRMTASNVGGPLAPQIRTAGRVMGAADSALGYANKGMGIAGAASGAYGLGRRIWKAPARESRKLLEDIPGADDTENPEINELEDNPLPAIWDGLTDRSDVADMQRSVARRTAPYTLGNAAYRSQQQADTDPVFGAAKALRQFTVAGQAHDAIVNRLADPTPAPSSQIIREEAMKHLPRVMNNYDANVASPTGQRLLRLVTPVVQNPNTPWAVNNVLQGDNPTDSTVPAWTRNAPIPEMYRPPATNTNDPLDALRRGAPPLSVATHAAAKSVPNIDPMAVATHPTIRAVVTDPMVRAEVQKRIAEEEERKRRIKDGADRSLEINNDAASTRSTDTVRDGGRGERSGADSSGLRPGLRFPVPGWIPKQSGAVVAPELAPSYSGQHQSGKTAADAAEVCPGCDSKSIWPPKGKVREALKVRRCTDCNHRWSVKEANDLMTQLRNAKKMSDVRDYSGKTEILRRLIQETPSAWHVDDDSHPQFVGITGPFKWKYHLPRQALYGLPPIARPQAIPAATVSGL